MKYVSQSCPSVIHGIICCCLFSTSIVADSNNLDELMIKMFCFSPAFSCLNGTQVFCFIVSFFVSSVFLAVLSLSSVCGQSNMSEYAEPLCMESLVCWLFSFSSVAANLMCMSYRACLTQSNSPFSNIVNLFVNSLTCFKNNIVFIINCFRHHSFIIFF